MEAGPLWITESDVAATLSLREAIETLDRGIRREVRGARTMLKTHVAWGGGSTLHALGGAFPDSGIVGTKTWAHTERGAAPLLVLFDSTNGWVAAIIEAFALGQLRTGAMSGLATRYLARENAADLALIGSGKQAMAQLAAVAAVRELRRVRIFSPTPDHREALARRAREEMRLAAESAGSMTSAVEGASIITLVTRAKEPLLTPAMVAPGTHINAIGAITPERMEFEPALLERCDQVVADSVPAVQQLSQEFRRFHDV